MHNISCTVFARDMNYTSNRATCSNLRFWNDFNPPLHPRKMVGTSIVINAPKFVRPGAQSGTGPPL